MPPLTQRCPSDGSKLSVFSAWISLLGVALCAGCAPSDPLPSYRHPQQQAETPLVLQASTRPEDFQQKTPQPSQAKSADFPPLVVLVPNDPNLLAVAQFTHGQGWYAVSMRLPDHMVYVTGHSSAFVQPAMTKELKAFTATQSPSKARAKGEVFATITHNIPSVSVNRFGAAYLVEIECAHPQTDFRCADLSAVRTLADNLQETSLTHGGQP